MYRRLLAGALAAACALAISACGLRFDGAPSGAQRDVVGDVVLTTNLCSDSDGGCGAVGITGSAQSLIAYRVPTGASAPALSADNALAYQRDDALAQHYEDTDHADGTRWYAFVSDARSFDAADTLSWAVAAAFPLPAGSPYRGPFDYKVVTGWRSASEDAVDCAVRRDLVAQGPSVTDCEADSATGSVPTRDLALSAPAATRSRSRASVQQGTGADLPFTATFAGASTPDADFALSASAPGLGAVTVSPDHLVPGTDSTSPLTVHVDVPAGTAPGDYPVMLTARLANGQTRTAAGSVTVTAAPAAAAASPTTTTTTVQGVTFTAPSTRTCLSRRQFTIMLLRHGRDLVDGTVTVDGRRVAVRRGARHMTARIDLRGMTGVVAVRIRARVAGGGKVDFTRRYRTCASAPGDNGLVRKGAI